LGEYEKEKREKEGDRKERFYSGRMMTGGGVEFV